MAQNEPTVATAKSEADRTALPYRDVKRVGAADFYFVINATFRFILSRFGFDGLQRYWQDLGVNYYAPVSESWRRGGLNAVANYWRAFFDAEPGAQVGVVMKNGAVVLEVKTCPAIKHLRAHGREIVPCFCQHCYFVGEAMANAAGWTTRVEGGNGTCRQTYQASNPALPPQDLNQIKEAT
jgi:hypothetical protein